MNAGDDATPSGLRRSVLGTSGRGPRRALRVGLCALALVVAGCGESGGNAHEHDEQGEEQAAVSFKEGRGLHLSPAAAQALGVTTEEIATRSIGYRHRVHATVFRAGPPAQASALVTKETADRLTQHPPREARIVRADRTRTDTGGQVELTLELPEPAPLGSGLRLTLTGPVRDVVAAPEDAVLRSAGGTFVYVVNGGALLRTPVTLGVSDGVYQEITDGVYEGDEVVTSAVEQLWLTELRLTKGGGHSH